MTAHLIADLIFVLIGAFIIWRCAHNGFIKCIFKFIRTVLALVLAYLLVAPVAPVVGEKLIEKPVYNFVFDEVNSIYEETGESLDVSDLLESLPESLQSEELKENLLSLDSSGEELVAAISKEVSAPIVSIISNVVTFILLFILIFLLLSVALWFLNSLISKINLIRKVNVILGLVWGVLSACVLWLVVSALMRLLFSGFSIYDDSAVIKFFAETDLFEKLLTSIID